MYNNYYTPGYNPMMPIQQRLSQMEQQFPQYSQNPYQIQQPQNQPQMTVLKGRAVTSIDEAKAAMIDLDGSVFVFPDIANKKIYTKQINLDGTAALNIYSLDTPSSPEKPDTSPAVPILQTEMLVNRKELDDVVTYLKNYIHTLESKIDQLNREVISDVQPYEVNDVSNSKSADAQSAISESSRNGKWKK